MSEETGRMTKLLFILTLILVFSAIGANFYKFYVQRDYIFTVEAPCGEGELCYIRSCDDGECPPNEFERYRTFEINASDFAKCEDNSCLNICVPGSTECEEIQCDESAGDTCTVVSLSE